jgi:Tol biopolymer transport system component
VRQAGLVALAAALVAIAVSGTSSHARPAKAAEPLIAFTVWDSAALLRSVYVTSAAGGRARILARSVHAGLSWSPDGRQLAFEKCRDLCDEIDLAVVRVDGAGERRLARFAHSPAWSPDGRLIAFVRGNDSLHVVAPDGSGLRQLVSGRAGIRAFCCPVWSPDGSRIAFPDGDGISIVSKDGGGLRRLVRSNAGLTLSWSADGRYLAFARYAPHRADAYVIASDGGKLRRVTRALRYSDIPVWSPDGGRIAFTGKAGREGGVEVYAIRPDGGGLRRLTAIGPSREPEGLSWSPDGKRIGFIVRASIYVVPARGGRARMVARGGDDECCTSFAWQPRP